ncbi:MAG: efflux RND transporter periplasmic adaptor subunit [Epsilonproteobacteria bacterium]|nr:efflux RND transporter periplasmic adaptor subunit [Campylobacterota bacterium]
MKSLYKILIGVVLIGVIAVVFYNKVYIPKTTYKTVQTKKEDIALGVFGIGEVGAKTIYNVTAGVSAKVLFLGADEGEWVKKGQVLAKFDSVDLPVLLQQSKIAVQKARSELIALQKELQSLQSQKHLAQITYERYAKLKKQSFASQSEYDKAKADLQVINAQLAATKAHIESSKTEVKRVAKTVDALEEKLVRYKVYAPINGYVIAKKAEISQALLPTQTLFEIVSPKDVWIKAYVDERISGDIKEGQNATITLRSSKQKYQGYVARIAPQSDAITQEREIDVAFKELPIPFYINEQAEVNVKTKLLNGVITAPAKALVYKQEKTYIWIKQGDKAHLQEVRLLGISGEKAALSGIGEGVSVLLASTKNKPLSEGMRVH